MTVIVAAEVYHANQGDAGTLPESLEQAQANLDEAAPGRQVEKAAADKGYHAAEALAKCQELGLAGVKTCIPEPELEHGRRWVGKPDGQQAAVYANRRRVARAYGQKLQRRRSEVVERSFAHVCDSGGSRRTWLRGLENVRKRYLISAAAHNLGLILRKLLGSGKPRGYRDLWCFWRLLQNTLFTRWRSRCILVSGQNRYRDDSIMVLSLV